MDIDHADYELIFDEHGSVTLLERGTQVWASDDDDDFADQFEGDMFGGDDAEEILEYLTERGLYPEDAPLDIVEFEPGESDDDDDD